MYVRALIVVLIVLNAGVALWWALQPAPAAVAAPPQPAGVARLEVLPSTAAASPAAPGEASEAGMGPAAAGTAPSDAPAPAPTSTSTSTSTSTAAAAASSSIDAAAAKVAATSQTSAQVPPASTVAPTPNEVAAAAIKPSPAVPVPAAAPERCASLGPYAARADADAALARLRGQTTRTRVREDKDAGVSTFRVMLPNVGDRAAAQALVKRIAAAGMGDYYVIAQGEDSSIALGQYQSRERAERRQASLVGAGFPAQLLPSGTGQSRWWIDVRSTAAIGTLQGTASAARQRSLDCAALR
ncbi:SPOR domain-containing protein [Xanthomonas arboricola pv. corylina]|uniref:SPOR domain-containing protein n=1 Tax=Xanthomonas arboricola TaxID=56448 RepID=UPI0025AFC2A3|nr:SPOR domain-containing protein [Xanthomonas arboricola]MDN0203416.1 SPOR domain-containing protein [Xanthomonas arboricola pv. corylina]MDN0216399.1 SPOR domain-containing protein [Xanthomonas arboricola pv. corylina]